MASKDYSQFAIRNSRRATRNAQLAPHLAALFAYFLLTVVMTWPMAAQWRTAIPGDGFDGWQNYWNLWWVKIALVDRLQTPFQTDLLYYPTGVDLYFHTLNPFNGVSTLPVQLSLGLIQAYNTVVLLSWVLAGYGVYLLLLWLLPATHMPVSRHLAAFIAGVIFTFAPFHMAHLLGHMQVMSLQWIPFYVLYLLRAIHQQQLGQDWLRSAILAGCFLTLTGLCDWYFVLYLFFFTGLVLLWGFVNRRGILAQRITTLLPPTVAGAVMLLLLSPLLIPMVRAASQFSFMVRPTTDLYILSATVIDFLIPNRLHTLFRPESFTWLGNQIAPVSERTISIGYTALGLTIIALWRWPFRGRHQQNEQESRRRQQNFWLLSTLFFVLLALGPQWHWFTITEVTIPEAGVTPASWTPFGLLNATIPFMRISRSVSRYALMVQLSIAILAGMGAAQLLRRFDGLQWGQRFRAITPLPALLTVTILLATILFESWVAPFPMSPPDTPAIYEQLPALVPELSEEGAVLNLPMNYDRPGYLLYQTVHQQPLTVAYISRDDPRTLTERVPLLQHLRHLGPDIIEGDPTVVGLAILQDLGVEIVVQDRYKMPGGLEREYTEALAAALFADQRPRYEDDRITVHAVPQVEQPQPYLMLGALNWGPLLTTTDGSRRRLVGAEGAALHIQHASLAMQLQLRYRSVTEASLEIYNADGTQLLWTLPAAPGGKVETLSLEGEPTILLQSSGAGGVWIEGVGVDISRP